MEKKISNTPKRRHWIILSISIALIIGLLVGVVVYAEYTKSSSVKRVVAPYESAGVLFSSNYMSMIVNNSYNRRLIYTGDLAAPVSAVVTLCNYAQGNPSIFYDADIEYTLNAKLVVVENGTKRDATALDIGSKYVDLTLNSTTIRLDSTRTQGAFAESTLLKGQASIDECIITFCSNFYDSDNVHVELETELDPDKSYPNIFNLEGVFTDYESSGASRSNWIGQFNESAVNPSALDGFNYTISGNGSGTCRLSWDSTKLTINQLFAYDELSGATISDLAGRAGWKYIDFSVNSETKDRYDTQFYRVDNTISFADWSALEDCVELEFSES